MTAVLIDYEAILQLVYQLPVRQRFDLVHDVLKSVEPTPPNKPTVPRALGSHVSDVEASTNEVIRDQRNKRWQSDEFWANRSVSQLAHAQGVSPTQTIDGLCTNAWPADESIKEFLTTLRIWRKDNNAVALVGADG